MKRSDWAKLYEPGARARVRLDGHAEGSITAVKSNCAPLSTDQRDGLFDACNKVLREENRPKIDRSAFNRMVE